MPYNAGRGAPLSRLISNAAAFALGLVLLVWPAIANQSPFLFYDTSQYLSIGKSIVAQIPGAAALSAGDPRAAPAESASAPVLTAQEKKDHPSLSYAGGRSAYYSAAAYVLASVGGLWSIALAQAMTATFVLWGVATATGRRHRRRAFLCLAGGLALASTLPFYLTMAMPDVFAGLGLLSLAVLLFARAALSRAMLIGLVLVASWSAATHLSTFAVMLLACVGGALLAALLVRFDRTSLLRSIGWGLSPLVLAGLGMLVYSAATRLVLGAAPKSPPYLMSRVLADGPGRAYLAEACATSSPYALCDFKDRNFRTSDDFLWSGDVTIGVFSVTNYETRKLLQEEELRFVANTVLHHPLWQFQVSFEHFAHQLVTFGIRNEFAQAAPSWDLMSFSALLPRDEASYTNGLAYRGLFPFGLFEFIQILAVVVSLAFLSIRLSRADVRHALAKGGTRDPAVLLVLCFAMLLLALVVNAAICGMLSGVYDRYQARVIWLVPTLAFATFRMLGPSARRDSR